MKSIFDPKLLTFLVKALQAPHPTRRGDAFLQSAIQSLAREGWVSVMDVEDLILESDPRLYGLDIGAFAEAACVPVRRFCSRPRVREREVFRSEGFEPADAVVLLIALRNLGFTIDPHPLADVVRPQLRTRASLNESELSVFWFNGRRDSFSGLTIQADEQRPTSIHFVEFITETNRRVRITVNQDGNPWMLSVLPSTPRKQTVELT